MLIVGMDVGGTSTRCVLADMSGHRVGAGSAAGGNPVSHGVNIAVQRISSAVNDAVRPELRSRVGAAVIGLAGLHQEPAIVDAVHCAWSGLGFAADPVLVADSLVTFAAGTPCRSGTVLIAGTGAVAVAVKDGEIEKVVDGHGWLLGDNGSGFWIGRQALKHTLGRLDHSDSVNPLAIAVQQFLLGRPGTQLDITRAVYPSPANIALIAPTVVELAEADDPDALAIVRRAAAHLEDTAVAARLDEDSSPIVLGGGLFNARVLSDITTNKLSSRWPAARITRAAGGASGAAWIAAQRLERSPSARLHHRLTEPESRCVSKERSKHDQAQEV